MYLLPFFLFVYHIEDKKIDLTTSDCWYLIGEIHLVRLGMKKAILIISLVVLYFFTFSCQQREEVAKEIMAVTEADIEAIRNWVNSSYATADSGDSEGYMGFWSEGLIWMPPNGPIIEGRSDAAEMIKTYFEQVAIQHEIWIKEIKVSGDFAFTRFNSEEKYTPQSAHLN